MADAEAVQKEVGPYSDPSACHERALKLQRQGAVNIRESKRKGGWYITYIVYEKRQNPKTKGKVKIVRNTQGYVAGGVFHPIRGADDYDPELAGDRGNVNEFGYAKKRKKAAVKKRKAVRKNPAPAKSFPVGKFVKVDKVRVNKNGTIDVMRTHAKRAVKRPRR